MTRYTHMRPPYDSNAITRTPAAEAQRRSQLEPEFPAKCEASGFEASDSSGEPTYYQSDTRLAPRPRFPETLQKLAIPRRPVEPVQLEEGVWGRNLLKVSPQLARPNRYIKIGQSLRRVQRRSLSILSRRIALIRLRPTPHPQQNLSSARRWPATPGRRPVAPDQMTLLGQSLHERRQIPHFRCSVCILVPVNFR